MYKIGYNDFCGFCQYNDSGKCNSCVYGKSNREDKSVIISSAMWEDPTISFDEEDEQQTVKESESYESPPEKTEEKPVKKPNRFEMIELNEGKSNE